MDKVHPIIPTLRWERRNGQTQRIIRCPALGGFQMFDAMGAKVHRTNSRYHAWRNAAQNFQSMLLACRGKLHCQETRIRRNSKYMMQLIQSFLCNNNRGDIIGCVCGPRRERIFKMAGPCFPHDSKEPSPYYMESSWIKQAPANFKMRPWRCPRTQLVIVSMALITILKLWKCHMKPKAIK